MRRRETSDRALIIGNSDRSVAAPFSGAAVAWRPLGVPRLADSLSLRPRPPYRSTQTPSTTAVSHQPRIIKHRQPILLGLEQRVDSHQSRAGVRTTVRASRRMGRLLNSSIVTLARLPLPRDARRF